MPQIPILHGALKRNTLDRIRTECEKLWSKGLIHFPDFTLHGVEHSQNIVGTLDKFKDEIATRNPQCQLNTIELYLLEAAAYLHDIGMLIDLDNFIEEQSRGRRERTWEDTRRKVMLEFCHQREFKNEAQAVEKILANENIAKPKAERDGELIRELHHIFSHHLIQWEPLARSLGIYGRETLFIARISRGHRSVDLTSPIYQDTVLEIETQTEQVRVGILAALLRIADEVDYSPNRVMDYHFEMYQGRLLKAPVSLGHWIKHYYVQSASSLSFEPTTGGMKQPTFTIYVAFPNPKHKKLIDDHVRESKRKLKTHDLKVQLERIGFTRPEIILRSVGGGRELPPRIRKEMGIKPPHEFIEELTERQMVDEWVNMHDLILKPLDISEEQAIKALKYKRLLFSVTYDWMAQESCEVLTEHKIAAQGQISTLWSRISFDIPPKLVSNKPRLQTISSGYNLKLTYRFTEGKRVRWYYVAINPALQRGSVPVHYIIHETFGNIFKTKQEISEKIKENNWKFREPREFISASIMTPTEELRMKIIFPKGYQVEEKGCGHLITFLGTPGVMKEEMENSSHKLYKKEGRHILELATKARLFCNYHLFWIPPK